MCLFLQQQALLTKIYKFDHEQQQGIDESQSKQEECVSLMICTVLASCGNKAAGLRGFNL